MIELKPCPFCGGPASYYEKGSLFAAIHCRKCGFGRRLEISDGTIRDISPSLCECWNKRAESAELDHLREQIKALREALENVQLIISENKIITGICTCGAPIVGHGAWSHHIPRDTGEVVTEDAINIINLALAKVVK